MSLGKIREGVLGPDAYFQKLSFALEPFAQAGHFEYHKPYKQNNFFSSF